MATVVVVGEVVLDRFIRAQEVTDVAGGSAANTALAMHIAGHDVSLRARYSTDTAGSFLRRTASDSGLNIRDSISTTDPATVVEISLDEKGVPTYAFHMSGTADWQWTQTEIAHPLPENCQAVVTGSLASVLEPGCFALLEWAQEVVARGVALAYDPNARPSALATHDADAIRHRIEMWVRASTIVKVSDEDLEWISPGEDPLAVASRWSTLGPQVVVVTGGPAGAWALRDGNLVAHVPAPTIDVVDTVGAGDTLMAWLVAGLMDCEATQRWSHECIELVLATAVKAAAITCTRRGCQPPTRRDLDS